MGRLVFQVSSEAAVSLTLPLESNAGRATGVIVRQSFDAVSEGRNSLDDVGRLLVYPKNRANETEIWIKDLMSGRERHLVTVTPSSQLDPIISHDGMNVAYTVREGGRAAGFIIPASGGKAKKVCDECILNGWFADNRRILALDAIPGPPGRCVALTSSTERQQTWCSIRRRRLGGLMYPRTAAGSVSRPAARCGSRHSAPATRQRKPNGYRSTRWPKARRNARVAGRRMADCCICCSNGTAFATCTLSAWTQHAEHL